MKAIEKAKKIIFKGDFTRAWDDLFENGEAQACKIICGLYQEAQKSDILRMAIIRWQYYMPKMLVNALLYEIGVK